jgi:hypothetical protein
MGDDGRDRQTGYRTTSRENGTHPVPTLWITFCFRSPGSDHNKISRCSPLTAFALQATDYKREGESRGQRGERTAFFILLSWKLMSYSDRHLPATSPPWLRTFSLQYLLCSYSLADLMASDDLPRTWESLFLGPSRSLLSDKIILPRFPRIAALPTLLQL